MSLKKKPGQKPYTRNFHPALRQPFTEQRQLKHFQWNGQRVVVWRIRFEDAAGQTWRCFVEGRYDLQTNEQLRRLEYSFVKE